MNKKIQKAILLIGIVGFLFFPFISQSQNTQPAQQPIKRSEEWILELQSNFNNPQWFYDNLNSTERKMIRQALDYAIPRQNIINDIEDGQTTTLATPIVPVNGPYYKKNITTRDYDYFKAASLLEQVFGYYYYDYYEDPNPDTPYDESKPYFPMTIGIYRSFNPIRPKIAGLIAFTWSTLGIDVDIKFFSYKELGSRIFDDPIGFGWDYNNGGFDALFVGWNIDPNPFLDLDYHSKSTVPLGYNYIFLNDSTVDNLIDISLTNTQKDTRIQSIHDFQDWFSENVPKSIITEYKDYHFLDINFKGFNPFLQTNFENWTINTQTNATIYLRTGLYDNHNPLYNKPDESGMALGGIYGAAGGQHSAPGLGGGLLTFDTLPNDPMYSWYVRPYLAKSYNVSVDGLTYFINLQPNLFWHDGYPLNATDIKFTYESIIDPAVQALRFSHWNATITDQSITILNETAVKIEFTKFDPYFESEYLTHPLIPEHILSDVPCNLTMCNWQTHYTHLPNATHGPIGYGPYKFKTHTETSSTWTWILEKWDGYNNDTMRTVEPSLDEIIFRYDLQDLSSDDVANLFQSGIVDLAWQRLSKDSFESATNVKTSILLGSDYQEVGYNMGSPIWGINPINPEEEYPEPPPTDPVTLTTTLYGTITQTLIESGEISTTTESTADFGDLWTIFGAFISMILIVSYSKRKKGIKE
ncbi:MAG: ABC transporter substrate-binding protein [Candidatus Hodarchaeales archaeon]|jgi:ABC-type transport system substrate-binding protein